jgi:hypothetical protein
MFSSTSCFLGLQDIEIGFGQKGVLATVVEMARVLKPGGVLALLDEFPFLSYVELLANTSINVIQHTERGLDVAWDRKTAELAIELYADGWATQARRLVPGKRDQALVDIRGQLTRDMEKQLDEQGYFIPFGPIRMVVGRKPTQTRAEGKWDVSA